MKRLKLLETAVSPGRAPAAPEIAAAKDVGKAVTVSDCCSKDFLSDQLFDGRKIGMLAIADNVNACIKVGATVYEVTC